LIYTPFILVILFLMSSDKIIIDSKLSSSFSLREIIKYKDLLNNLAKRDFSVRYKQAIFGVIWALIRPVFNILVFGYIASKINGAANTIDNFILVASAMLLWQLFTNVFSEVSNSIVGNSNLYSKVYFPKIIIPISSILVCLVDFLISILILVVLFIIAGKGIHWQIIFAPFFVLLSVLFALGIGLFFATLFVKYRDVRFVVPIIIQFGMYVSPVIFSTAFYLDRIPSWMEPIYYLNPMVGAIEGFKYSLLGYTTLPSLWYILVSVVFTLICLYAGLKYFFKYERDFVDYI